MLLHTCRLSGCVFRSFCYVLRGPNEGLNPSECGCFCVCGWCKEDRQEVRYNVDRNSSLTRCVCVWDGFMPQSCQTSASSWYPQTFSQSYPVTQGPSRHSVCLRLSSPFPCFSPSLFPSSPSLTHTNREGFRARQAEADESYIAHITQDQAKRGISASERSGTLYHRHSLSALQNLFLVTFHCRVTSTRRTTAHVKPARGGCGISCWISRKHHCY